jgi:hypothetical protein
MKRQTAPKTKRERGEKIRPVTYYLLGIRNAALTLTIMIAVARIFGVWFVRYSKVLWLALDLTLHPPHSEDFEPRGRQE